MERRGEPRIKKRISCELTVGERRFGGLVLDVSSHGLFVQTAATPAPGDCVHVAVSAPNRPEPLELDAVVARARLVPPQLRTVAQGGLGLHIAEPSADFARFVEDVKRPVKIKKVSVLSKDASPRTSDKKLTKERLDRFFAPKAKGQSKVPTKSKPDAGDAPAVGPYTQLPRWRVQLRHVGGQGSRSFVIRCESEAEARDQVLAEIDDDWKIEGIVRI